MYQYRLPTRHAHKCGTKTTRETAKGRGTPLGGYMYTNNVVRIASPAARGVSGFKTAAEYMREDERKCSGSAVLARRS